VLSFSSFVSAAAFLGHELHGPHDAASFVVRSVVRALDRAQELSEIELAVLGRL
jgi:hypothetical protein